MSAVVQALTKNKANGVTSKTSATTDWPANVTAGNSILVTIFCWDGTATYSISSVTDSNGNTYVKDKELTYAMGGTTFDLVSIFRCHNVAGGNKPTITVTASKSVGNMVFGAVEASGLQNTTPNASNSNGTTTSSTTPTPGAITTTVADCLSVIICVGIAGGTYAWTEPTGYTSRCQETDMSTSLAGDAATTVFSAVQTNHTPQWTVSPTTGYAACIAAYSGDASVKEQSAYRWRDDDGTETSAGWLAGEGSDVTRPLAANTRLRVQLNAASGDPPANAYQLECKKSTDAGYSKVPSAQPTSQLPTFVAKGVFNSGTAALTVAQPAGIQAGDLLLLFVETANQAMTTPAGWSQVTNSPQGTGTAAAAGGVRLTVFYKIAGSSESSVSLADSGDHQTAIIMAFRGVDNATPFNATAGKVDAAATTAVSWPAVTTTQDNCLVVNAVALDRDAASTTNLSAVANAALSDLTKQHDQTVVAGAGGGLAVVTGGLAAAGGSGNTTATDAASTTHAYLTLALNPTPVSPLPVLLSDSANVAAGGSTATTAQLVPPAGKTTSSFQAGYLSDDTNPLASIDLATGTYTELEWCLQAVSPAADGDVYQFQVTSAGAALNTYTVTPQWTVGTAGGGPATSPAAILGHL